MNYTLSIVVTNHADRYIQPFTVVVPTTDLRNGLATWLVAKGSDIDAIQQLKVIDDVLYAVDDFGTYIVRMLSTPSLTD